MKFINWFNSLSANMQFVFVFCSIAGLICLGMVVYSLVCIINVKRLKRIERENQRFLLTMPFIAASPRCDENGNVIFGKTRLLTDFVFALQEAVEEEMRKKRLEAIEEYRRIQHEFHKPGFFCDEQRPENWKPEEPVLHFDNPFSDLPRIPIRHCSEAAPLFVHLSIDKMQNGKEIKFTPEILNCFCGGKGKLVKYTKCEGKDAYPMSLIVCNSCGIQTKEFCAKKDNVVIEAWNKIMSGAHVEKGDSENDTDCV